MTLSYKIHTATTGDVSGQPLGYSFNFPSLSANDITVTVGGNPKTLTTDYTVENWTADAGNNPYVKFTSSTARGSGTIRISRGTTSTSPTHDFQVGSAIKAADLNSCNQQNIYLAQENRDSINALALGDASSAIQIDSANIKNLTIQAIDLATDAVETDKIKNLNVTTGKLADNAVTNNKVDTNAAIQGTKISPDFGSQNIVTTGTLTSGDMTISDASPRILFTETDADPDWKVVSVGGEFRIHDETNDEDRVIVNQDGHVDVKAHLDVNGGADVTGDVTVTGNVANDVTVTGNISTSGNDVYLSNGTLISNDSEGAFSNRGGTNIDHIWHNDTNSDSNTGWNFCSDTSYKSTGNAKVRAGEFHGDGSNLTGLAVQDVKVAWNTSETNFGNNSSWHTHLEVGPFTNVTSSSKFLVVAVYEIKNESTSTNCSTQARITESGGTLTPNATNTRQGNSYVKYTHIEIDRANSSSNRTYRVQCRATNSHTSCNAFMDNAFLCAFHLKPS